MQVVHAKSGYIAARVVGLLVIIVLGCVIAIQSSAVQTRLTLRVLDRLTEAFEGRVIYDELKLMPSGVLMLSNAAIIDEAPHIPDFSQAPDSSYALGFRPADTLFRAKTITATISFKGLLRGDGLYFRRVNVSDAMMHLTIEPGESNTNIKRIFHLPTTEDRPEPGPEILNIKKVKVTNFRYVMTNYRQFFSKGNGMDYRDLDLVADVRGRSLKFSGGRMSGIADEVSLHEKSGYRAYKISGRCIAGQGKTEVENVRLHDPWSDLTIKSFTMSNERKHDFREFVDLILLECELGKGELGIPTLMYLTGLFPGNESTLSIESGKFAGYVNSFSVSSLKATDKESGIAFTLDGSATGLPDFGSMTLDVNIQAEKLNGVALTSFLGSWAGIEVPAWLPGFAPGTDFSLTARADGPIDRLDASASLDSESGSLELCALIRNLGDSTRSTEISAETDVNGIDISAVAGNLRLGRISLTASGGIRMDRNSPAYWLDTLDISSVEFNGAEYEDISVSGSYINDTIRGRVNSRDPSLILSLDARALAGKEKSEYSVSGSVGNADLFKLGLDRREVRNALSFNFDADLDIEGHAVDGHVRILDSKFSRADGITELGDIELQAYSLGSGQFYSLSSSFVDISAAVTGTLSDFVEDVQNITLRSELPALYPSREPGDSLNFRYNMEIQFHDSRNFMSYFMPGLYVSERTRVAVSADDNGILNASLRSPRIAYRGNHIKDVDIQLNNEDGRLFAYLNGEEVSIGNIPLKNTTLTTIADDNNFSFNVAFDGFAENGGNGEIRLEGSIQRDSLNRMNITASTLDSFLMTNDGIWRLSDAGMSYNGREFFIDGLELSKDEQSLSVNGGYSLNREQTLDITAENIDLSALNYFFENDIGLEGHLQGGVTISSGTGERFPGMNISLKLDSLALSGADVGVVRVYSSLDDGRESMRLHLRHTLDGREALYATGTYSLSENDFELNARMNGFPLHIAAPFLSGVLSELGGGISGNISMSRSQGELSLKGSGLSMDDARVGVRLTGVSYSLNGPMELDNDGLYFKDITVGDGSPDGRGNIEGALLFDKPKSFRMDTRLRFDNLLVVNAPEKDNQGVYGRLRASGNAELSGPFETLNINAAVRTSGTGELHIPTSGSAVAGTGNLLTFSEPTRPSDPYDEVLEQIRAEAKSANDITIQARVSAQPDAMIYVEFDKASGNMVSFNGEGSVNLYLRPSRSVFEINGEYDILEGDYVFAIPGILNREFEIQEGSSINFGGGIPDSNVNIDAIYRLKTSLSSLISTGSSLSSSSGSSESGTASTRTVECGIHISGQASNPRLSFSINVPDLNPTIKSQVESALNTDDKVQKQFIALMVMGSFIPDENSGIVNGSDILLSNVTELMSNQLNSILQKLEIPFDLGIGYQGLSNGSNVFDVAVSTQLFNNRVIVGGNLGSRRYGSSTNGDVVGDLDIQIKLDPEGKFRLNLFSHSADEYSNYLDYSQRNGAGFSYQKGYGTLKEFMNSIFRRKKKNSGEEQPTTTPRLNVIRVNDDEESETLPDTDADRG